MKLFSIVMLIAAISVAATADVYTVQYRGHAYSCGLDGSNPAQLATGGDFERFSAVDASGDYVYVGIGSTSAGNGIIRYNLDGTNATILSSNTVKADSIQATSSNLYYISGMDIHIADLDGSNDSVLYTLGTGLTAFWGDSLSVVGSSLYWVVDDRRFQTCNLDGSGATQIFQAGSSDGLSSACTDGNYIYYALDASDSIYRRDMDGSNATLLLSDATQATGVSSLQIADGVLYWAASNRSVYGYDLGSGSVAEQYNFDTVFSSSLSRTIYFDVEVVPEPATITLLAVSGLFLLKRRNRAC